MVFAQSFGILEHNHVYHSDIQQLIQDLNFVLFKSKIIDQRDSHPFTLSSDWEKRAAFLFANLRPNIFFMMLGSQRE